MNPWALSISGVSKRYFAKNLPPPGGMSRVQDPYPLRQYSYVCKFDLATFGVLPALQEFCTSELAIIDTLGHDHIHDVQ